jgi:replicative DNA helicase
MNDLSGTFARNVVPFGPPAADQERRPLPANVDVEQALLGAILVNNDAYPLVAPFLEAKHFSEELHRRVYDVATSLIREGRVATPLTLRTFLGDQDLGGVTIPQYLARLAAEATTVINAEHYARLIHDLYIRRQLIGIAGDMADLAYDSPVSVSPAAQIEKAQEALAVHQVALSDRERRSVNIRTAVTEVMEDLEKAEKGEEEPMPLTRIERLDREIVLAPSTVVTVPARTSMGKSIVGTEFAMTTAEEGFAVIIHSLEMSRKQVLLRMASSRLERSGERIPYERMMKPKSLTPEERWAVADTLKDLEGLPIHIEDGGGRTILDIAASSERIANSFAKKGYRLGMVNIDHAHIVSFTQNYKDDVKALKEVTQGALNLCKRLDTCVLLLAQCNRGTESRGDDDRRPRLSDIRGAGSFEEDSDVIVFPFRPAYYVERSAAFRRGPIDEAGMAARDEYERTKHILEFIIDKNRAGRAGQVIEAWVNPALNAIRNLDSRGA